MNSSNFRFVLDLHSTQSQISIPVTRGDTARVWYISFSDGGAPYIIADGCLASIGIKRPNGTFLEAFCSIENNTVIKYDFNQDDITKNTAALPGAHDCFVTVYGGGGEKISSARFTMVVSDKAINSDDINISDEDKTSIDAMITAEVSRQAAEIGRVNAEAERQQNEVLRQKTLGKCESALIMVDEKVAEIEDRAANGEFDGRDGIDGGLLDYRLDTSFDNATKELTVSLFDIAGNVVKSSTVSIPLESIVVSGSVSKGTVTLSLSNGRTITFGISELVDDLASTEDVRRMIASAVTDTLNSGV